ncbi:hypothetical protein M153_12800017827 [Pseudoloma neurophilia]|uniref:Uncharacterized protein n=1 Tax=Pseudoloma neurophilia TaxID=146866 RepID=A0A0R0M406_9MICR|nr:hypothetical protein M153_12800017827 [Pseudoloma neurophilia]
MKNLQRTPRFIFERNYENILTYKTIFNHQICFKSFDPYLF